MTEMKTTRETKEARRDTGGLAAVFTFDREPAARQEDVRAAVTAGAGLSSSYFIMNAAATLIAGYGLLADSVAVIIGAMLIAMLYGPILGLGLAMARASEREISTRSKTWFAFTSRFISSSMRAKSSGEIR